VSEGQLMAFSLGRKQPAWLPLSETRLLHSEGGPNVPLKVLETQGIRPPVGSHVPMGTSHNNACFQPGC
jgi:hypothetical protein